MRRCLCSAPSLGLERWSQQLCSPFVHLLGEDGSGMHRQPDILLIAPDMVGQTNGHRWGAWHTTLASALMRHPNVVEADHEPDLPPVARAAPGQTPGPAPQGRDQPPQGAIPPFHQGRLDRLPELPKATPRRNQLPIANAVWTHATCLGRSLACASSHCTPSTATCCTLCRWCV